MKTIIFILFILSFSLCFEPTNTVTWTPCARYTKAGRKKSEDDALSFKKILFSIREKLGLVSKFEISPQKHTYVSKALSKMFTFPYTPFLNPENSEKYTNYFKMQKRSNLKNFNLTNFDENLKIMFEKEEKKNEGREREDPHFGGIECAKIQVPLFWEKKDDPNGVYSFVKRFKSKKQSKGRIWLLQGGPGGDSTVFEQVVDYLAEELDFSYDFMLIDHRGVGRSSPLHCIGKLSDCTDKFIKKFGTDSFQTFSATSASNDLGYWINLMKKEEPNKDIVYGVSYGTFWLNRLLTLYPESVDMAIADSVVTPGKFDFFDWDSHGEEIGNELIAQCESDEFCVSKFEDVLNAKGTGKTAVKQAFSQAFDLVLKSKQENSNVENKCASIFSTYLLKVFFALSLVNDELRIACFPIIYRILRCSEEKGDIVFLNNIHFQISSLDASGIISLNEKKKKIPFFENINSTSSLLKNNFVTDESVYGGIEEALYINIVCSEIASENPNSKEYYIDKYFKNTPPFFWPDASRSLIEMCHEYNKVNGGYSEKLKNEMAKTYLNPMLSLQGTLDPQTPLKQSLNWRDHFVSSYNNNSHHYFAIAKNSYHGVIFATRTPFKLLPFAGMRLMAEWIQQNGEQVPNIELLMKYKDFFIDFSQPTTTLIAVTAAYDLWEGYPEIDIVEYYQLFFVFMIAVGILIFCVPFVLICTIYGLVLITMLSVFVTIFVIIFSTITSIFCCFSHVTRSFNFGNLRNRFKKKNVKENTEKFHQLEEDGEPRDEEMEEIIDENINDENIHENEISTEETIN